MLNLNISTASEYVKEITRLVDGGQDDMAQFVCARFVAQFPTEVLGHVLMSRVLFRNGHVVQAHKYILLANDLLSPASVWNDVLSVSTTLMTSGEDELALRVLDTIEIDHPKNKSALLEIASQYSVMGSQEKASEIFEYAKSQGHTSASLHHLYGKVLLYTGPIEAAAASLEKAVAMNPKNGNAHWSLAVLEMDEGRLQRIERMESILDGQSMTGEDLLLMNYALFREYDRLNEVDKAWHYLMLACEERRKQVFYDKQIENRNFDRLVEVTQSLKIPPLQEPSSEAVPVFIVGMPRTGTTLLERILGNFAQVQPCGELTVFRNQLQYAIDKRLEYPFDSSLTEGIAALDLAEIGKRYLAKTHWLTNGKPYFTDKHPINFNFAGLIAAALPQARIINLTRNPMDTCFSNLKEYFGPFYYTYSYRLDELANHYFNYRKLMAHWHRIAPGRILDVRYEDLVEQPEIEAERVRVFCGLPKTEGLTDISRNTHITTTASTVQLRQPVHRKNVEAWARYKNQLAGLYELLSQLQQEYYGQNSGNDVR